MMARPAATLTHGPARSNHASGPDPLCGETCSERKPIPFPSSSSTNAVGVDGLLEVGAGPEADNGARRNIDQCAGLRIPAAPSRPGSDLKAPEADPCESSVLADRFRHLLENGAGHNVDLALGQQSRRGNPPRPRQVPESPTDPTWWSDPARKKRPTSTPAYKPTRWRAGHHRRRQLYRHRSSRLLACWFRSYGRHPGALNKYPQSSPESLAFLTSRHKWINSWNCTLIGLIVLIGVVRP